MALQAESVAHSSTSSERASALLRRQVKQTAAEASELNSPSARPSSSATASTAATAAIAIQPPPCTSQQALHSLASASDAATLGSPSSSGVEPDSTHEAPDAAQSVHSASEAAADSSHEAPDPPQSVRSAAEAAAADDKPSYDSIPESPSQLGGADRSSSSQLPTNLSMLQFAQQSEATRYHNKTKLESFDKIIGRAPNTPHHVSLQAAPTQKAYLPQWLASPLGMQPSQHTGSTVPGIGPKKPGTASVPISRFTTEDTELNYSPPDRVLHRDMSVRAPPPQHRQQLQLHQADPHQPVTPLQPPRQAAAVPSTPIPFATPGHSWRSPDRYKPPRPLARAASDTTICKSSSMGALSPGIAKAQSGSAAEQDSEEGSFVSLHLQTVRPTALRPYQTAHFGPPPPTKGASLYTSAQGHIHVSSPTKRASLYAAVLGIDMSVQHQRVRLECCCSRAYIRQSKFAQLGNDNLCLQNNAYCPAGGSTVFNLQGGSSLHDWKCILPALACVMHILESRLDIAAPVVTCLSVYVYMCLSLCQNVAKLQHVVQGYC